MTRLGLRNAALGSLHLEGATEVVDIDIGKKRKRIHVDPQKLPLPEKEPAPEREPVREQPKEPQKV
jgi:hypothetical protein